MSDIEDLCPEEARYIKFPSIDHGAVRNGLQVLNRWSSTLTKDHDFPAAQVIFIHGGPFYKISTIGDGAVKV